MGSPVKWSQLKLRIESFFADSVRKRVSINSTTYHKWNDSRDAGRVWITIDGTEVLNLCFNYAIFYPEMGDKLVRQLDRLGIPSQPGDGSEVDRREKLILSRGEVHDVLFNYLSMPVDDILNSNQPFIRGLAMLDRRVGKRRLSQSRDTETHPWPRMLSEFRLKAEEESASAGSDC